MVATLAEVQEPVSLCGWVKGVSPWQLFPHRTTTNTLSAVMPYLEHGCECGI